MGVVYRAEELALQRPVALKLIRPEYSGDQRFRERFKREAGVAAAIDHPNVIPIFDTGEEAGVLYLTMRLVEGTDLRALIAEEGRLDPLRAARIVRPVGAALDAAHARGMLHRDVKPSNVLLSRDDHVYLSDFGLAKPLASVGELTRYGRSSPAPSTSRPSRCSSQRVDARADIYALGCVLFEALTGQTRRWAGAQAIAQSDLGPPSPVAVRPDLPREFDEVLRRSMATRAGRALPVRGRPRPGGDGRRRRPETRCAVDGGRLRRRLVRAEVEQAADAPAGAAPGGASEPAPAGDTPAGSTWCAGDRGRLPGDRRGVHGRRAEGHLEPLTARAKDGSNAS